MLKIGKFWSHHDTSTCLNISLLCHHITHFSAFQPFRSEPLRSSVVENIHRIHQAKESLGGVADSPSIFLVKWGCGFFLDDFWLSMWLNTKYGVWICSETGLNPNLHAVGVDWRARPSPGLWRLLVERGAGLVKILRMVAVGQRVILTCAEGSRAEGDPTCPPTQHSIAPLTS